jgi:hypothetical protein
MVMDAKRTVISLAKPILPIPRLTSLMGNRNDLDAVSIESVDQGEWKATEQESST